MPSDDSDQPAARPRIIPIPNGPLHLVNSQQPEVVENLRDSKGAPISRVVRVALCRCGISKAKPFCDASHARAGFTSENKVAPQTIDKRKDYFGKGITVHDNRRVCSHSAECLRNLGTVFNLKERPWINPDKATVESVIDAVSKCPSGALGYSIDGVEYTDVPGRKPAVIVERNGPYYIQGGIELAGIENWGTGVSREHYALCRCGASNNKPFCDGNHLSCGFNDGQ